MGVDLAYINQKQTEIAAQAASRGSGGHRFWAPSDGNNKIRLMPPWAAGVRSFEREVYIHFGVGEQEQVFTCPGQGCPICKHVDALRATQDPADIEVANRISKKKRYYSNIIDMNDPVFSKKDVEEWKQGAQQGDNCPFQIGQTKVQIFGYGAMIYQQLINMFAMLSTDLTDLQSGYDLIITKQGSKLNTKYTVIPAPPAKPVVVSGELLLTNLDAIMPPKKLEEMQTALAGGAPQLPPQAHSAPPSLPPPANVPPAQALPPVQQYVAPPPAAVAPAPAPTPPPAAAAPAPSPDDAPPCFKDKVTFAETDAECAGGEKGGDKFDKCPYFQDCGTHAGKLVSPPTSRRRAAPAKTAAAPAAAPPVTAMSTEADALEAQMKAALA